MFGDLFDRFKDRECGRVGLGEARGRGDVDGEKESILTKGRRRREVESERGRYRGRVRDTNEAGEAEGHLDCRGRERGECEGSHTGRGRRER